eukprot:TRINITY_DN96410_c0_g1_i1.p1 TRINITY_DN96410_c0_g1~~TRINITY_DN96410_c0_g1_i1.p1  ORF type:complete len:380 (+),score=67.44 TRINITY_DN96410_c0_g1_i1:40-1179(+)
MPPAPVPPAGTEAAPTQSALQQAAPAPKARQRNSSPAGPRQAGAASKAAHEDDKKADAVATGGVHAALAMAGWIALLVGTQMVMLIYTKRCTDRAGLPLLLCLAQFITSASLSAAASVASIGRIPLMPRTLWRIIVPLSVVWTAGFVLFNASASRMSPALVSLVRCMEPLATVFVGFALGERYSCRVLATLIPICGGVGLASFKGGVLSVAGISLALLSNLSFCGRPFFTQQLKQHRDNKLNDLGVFFNVTGVAVVLLPVFVFLLEGVEILPQLQRLSAAGQLFQYGGDLLASSIFFFLYQLTQLVVMSKMTPLAFSVLTPVVKAFMIVACSLYFGDPFGMLSAVGVVVSTSGGYLFTLARSADGKKSKSTQGEAKKSD